jgi:hypothetical protein
MASEFVFLFSFVVFLTIFPLAPCLDLETSLTSNSTATPTVVSTTTQNSTHGNETATNESKGIMETVFKNKGMLMRAFYVLIGITAIVVVYFGVRAWR